MTKDQTIRIFAVGDDPEYQRLCKYVAEIDSEHDFHSFPSGRACLDNLGLKPDIVLLDYSLPDMPGEELFQKISAYSKDIGIVILSDLKDISKAVKLFRHGTFDFIPKDEETKELLQNTLYHLKEKVRLKREVDVLKAELVDKYDICKHLIGQSPPMQEVCHLIEKAVKSNINISIQGESGTGKEVVAKCIHHNSARRNGSFIALNMSAIPQDLMESELFGYEKGAFTGALTRKKGQFELSNGGTLFLDEIADLHITMQAKLLRALQEREFIRVGGQSPIAFDARLIVSTHKDLVEEVRKGRFREDLYYRLLGLNIKIPPLRERGKDILLLAKSFLVNYAKQNATPPLELSKDAKNKLMAHSFPGNVRELMAVTELGAVLSEGSYVEADDIQFSNLSKESQFFDQTLTMEEYKDEIIRHYLRKYNDNVQIVADKLNIGKSTIYRLLQEKK